MPVGLFDDVPSDFPDMASGTTSPTKNTLFEDYDDPMDRIFGALPSGPYRRAPFAQAVSGQPQATPEDIRQAEAFATRLQNQTEPGFFGKPGLGYEAGEWRSRINSWASKAQASGDFEGVKSIGKLNEALNKALKEDPINVGNAFQRAVTDFAMSGPLMGRTVAANLAVDAAMYAGQLGAHMVAAKAIGVPMGAFRNAVKISKILAESGPITSAIKSRAISLAMSPAGREIIEQAAKQAGKGFAKRAALGGAAALAEPTPVGEVVWAVAQIGNAAWMVYDFIKILRTAKLARAAKSVATSIAAEVPGIPGSNFDDYRGDYILTGMESGTKADEIPDWAADTYGVVGGAIEAIGWGDPFKLFTKLLAKRTILGSIFKWVTSVVGEVLKEDTEEILQKGAKEVILNSNKDENLQRALATAALQDVAAIFRDPQYATKPVTQIISEAIDEGIMALPAVTVGSILMGSPSLALSIKDAVQIKGKEKRSGLDKKTRDDLFEKSDRDVGLFGENLDDLVAAAGEYGTVPQAAVDQVRSEGVPIEKAADELQKRGEARGLFDDMANETAGFNDREMANLKSAENDQRRADIKSSLTGNETQEQAAAMLEYIGETAPKRGAKRKLYKVLGFEAEKAAPAGASVPVMITRDMRQQLHDLGFSKEHIAKMTPEQAWDAIKKGATVAKTTATDAYAAASPENKKQVDDALNALKYVPEIKERKDVSAYLQEHLALPKDVADEMAAVARPDTSAKKPSAKKASNRDAAGNWVPVTPKETTAREELAKRAGKVGLNVDPRDSNAQLANKVKNAEAKAAKEEKESTWSPEEGVTLRTPASQEDTQTLVQYSQGKDDSKGTWKRRDRAVVRVKNTGDKVSIKTLDENRVESGLTDFQYKLHQYMTPAQASDLEAKADQAIAGISENTIKNSDIDKIASDAGVTLRGKAASNLFRARLMGSFAYSPEHGTWHRKSTKGDKVADDAEGRAGIEEVSGSDTVRETIQKADEKVDEALESKPADLTEMSDEKLGDRLVALMQARDYMDNSRKDESVVGANKMSRAEIGAELNAVAAEVMRRKGVERTTAAAEAPKDRKHAAAVAKEDFKDTRNVRRLRNDINERSERVKKNEQAIADAEQLGETSVVYTFHGDIVPTRITLDASKRILASEKETGQKDLEFLIAKTQKKDTGQQAEPRTQQAETGEVKKLDHRKTAKRVAAMVGGEYSETESGYKIKLRNGVEINFTEKAGVEVGGRRVAAKVSRDGKNWSIEIDTETGRASSLTHEVIGHISWSSMTKLERVHLARAIGLRGATLSNIGALDKNIDEYLARLIDTGYENKSVEKVLTSHTTHVLDRFFRIVEALLNLKFGAAAKGIGKLAGDWRYQNALNNLYSGKTLSESTAPTPPPPPPPPHRKIRIILARGQQSDRWAYEMPTQTAVARASREFGRDEFKRIVAEYSKYPSASDEKNEMGRAENIESVARGLIAGDPDFAKYNPKRLDGSEFVPVRGQEADSESIRTLAEEFDKASEKARGQEADDLGYYDRKTGRVVKGGKRLDGHGKAFGLEGGVDEDPRFRVKQLPMGKKQIVWALPELPEQSIRDAVAKEYGAESHTTFADLFKKREERAQMVGEKAKGVGNTSEAARMEREGSSRESIWSNTGWYRGTDGRWRFEVDDSKMRLPGLRQTKEMAWIDGEHTVGDVYPRIVDAYPDMADIPIRFNSGRSGGEYVALPRPGYITVGVERDAASIRATLAHEIQHAIQRIERFAPGGNLEDGIKFAKSKRLSKDETAQRQERFIRLLNKVLSERKDLDGVDDSIVPWNKSPLRAEMRNRDSGIVSWWESLDKASRDAIFKTTLADEINAYATYKTFSGEAESRLVERRLDMTPEQRKAEPPWVSMEKMLKEEGLLNEGQKPEDVLIVRLLDRFFRIDERAQDAYHGTPHTLNPEPGFPHGRFRLNKFGSGTGDADFGKGIYFTESNKIGESYAGFKGRTYKLDIPSEVIDSLIDYDAEVPQSVIDALREQEKGLRQYGKPYIFDSKILEDAKDSSGKVTGSRLLWKMGKNWNDWAVTEKLTSVGVRGIKYWANRRRVREMGGDPSSSGVRNYVIWDQSALDKIVLLERNGEKLDQARQERAQDPADYIIAHTFGLSYGRQQALEVWIESVDGAMSIRSPTRLLEALTDVRDQFFRNIDPQGRAYIAKMIRDLKNGVPIEQAILRDDARAQDVEYSALEQAAKSGDQSADSRAAKMVSAKWKSAGYDDGGSVGGYYSGSSGENARFTSYPSDRQMNREDGRRRGYVPYLGRGLYLTSRRAAGGYASFEGDGTNPTVRKYVVRGRGFDLSAPVSKTVVENLLKSAFGDRTEENWFARARAMAVYNENGFEFYNRMADAFGSADKLNSKLAELGYTHIVDDRPESAHPWQVLVFDPSAAKLADTFTYSDDGTLIPLSERFNDQSNDIRAQDAAYSDLERLARSGDKDAEAEAKKIAIDAGRAAGYEHQMFRGDTRKGVTVFGGGRRVAIWTTSSRDHAENFTAPADETTAISIGEQTGAVYPVLVRAEKPWTLFLDDPSYQDALAHFGRVDWENASLGWRFKSGQNDSVIVRRGTAKRPGAVESIAVSSPSQIKSADAFTYRDDGTLEPLSERFNISRKPHSESRAQDIEVVGRGEFRAQPVDLRREFNKDRRNKNSEYFQWTQKNNLPRTLKTYGVFSRKQSGEKNFADHIWEDLKDKPQRFGEFGPGVRGKIMRKISKWARATSGLLNTPTLARLIGKNTHKYVTDKLHEAGTKQDELKLAVWEDYLGKRENGRAKMDAFAQYRPRDEYVGDLDGIIDGKVVMTRGQRLSLIRMMMNKAARRALVRNGFTIYNPDGGTSSRTIRIKGSSDISTKQGEQALMDKLEAYAAKINASEKDTKEVNDILDHVFDKIIFPRLAEALKEYNGKDLAMQEHYLRMVRERDLNPNVHSSRDRYEMFLGDISALQERRGGTSPIEITDFARSMQVSAIQAAKFVGYAKIAQDLRAGLGMGGMDVTEDSRVRQMIDSRMGANIAEELSRRIQDLEGVADPHEFSLIRKIMRKMDIARLSGPSTVLKQIPAIWLPAMEYGWTLVARGLMSPLSAEERSKVLNSKNGSMVKWRLQSHANYDELADRQMELEGRLEKVAMFGIRRVDEYSVKKYIDIAAEVVSAQNPSLSGEDYYNEVAKLASNMVNSYQPSGHREYRTGLHNAGLVGLVLNRYRASANAIYNTVFRSWMDAKQAGGMADQAKLMAPIVGVLMMQALFFAGSDSLWDWLKELTELKDDKKKRKPPKDPMVKILDDTFANLAEGLPLANVWNGTARAFIAAARGDTDSVRRYERYAQTASIPPFDTVTKMLTQGISTTAKLTALDEKLKDGKISRRAHRKEYLKERGKMADTAISVASEFYGLPSYWMNRYVHAGERIARGLD